MTTSITQMNSAVSLMVRQKNESWHKTKQANHISLSLMLLDNTNIIMLLSFDSKGLTVHRPYN